MADNVVEFPAIKVVYDRDDPPSYLVLTHRGQGWAFVCSAQARNEARAIAEGFGLPVWVQL